MDGFVWLVPVERSDKTPGVDSGGPTTWNIKGRFKLGLHWQKEREMASESRITT